MSSCKRIYLQSVLLFQANTIEDISCAWKKCSGTDCWIVVANTHVMLNNRKFLSKFIKAG